MTQPFCFPTLGLSIPNRLHVWFSEPGLFLPSISLPLPHWLGISIPHHCRSTLPATCPIPHPGSWLRGAQPGTQRGTRTGSCLACSRSAHGHRVEARGGTRPRLRAQTAWLGLGQTLRLLASPRRPGEAGRRGRQGRSQASARARPRQEPGAVEGLGGARFKAEAELQRGGQDKSWGPSLGRGREGNSEGGNLGRAGPGEGKGGKNSFGDRTKGRQERGKGWFGDGAVVWQGGNEESW